MPDLAMAIYSVSGNIQRAIAPTDMGTVLYADGTTYRGALLAGGVPQGDGSAKFQDLEYSGAWQAGVRHGEGTLVAPVRRYEGGWVGGRENGNGTASFSQGNVIKYSKVSNDRVWFFWRISDTHGDTGD